MYRSVNADGDVLKCAGGWLIPDEVYNVRMEGKAVNHLPYFRDRYNEGTLNFMVDLQGCHDFSTTTDFMADFTLSARRSAKHFGLDAFCSGLDNQKKWKGRL